MNKTLRYDEYVSAYQETHSQTKAAQKCGVSRETIARAVQRAGIQMDGRRYNTNHARQMKITDEQILDDISNGFTRKEIADRHGVHVENLAKRMRRLGVHARYPDRVSNCSSKKNRYKHTREEYQKILQDNADIKSIEKIWYRSVHTVQRECKICGSLFYCLDTQLNQTCSHECSKKYKNRKSDKRINKQNIVDSDITLKKLFFRDSGICMLCGENCDWNDYSIVDGHFVAKNNYPSIDHIVPLARNGKHSWENVQLAHFKCNREKGDVTSEFTKEMSREYARRYAIERNTQKKKTAQYSLDGILIRVWDSTGQIRRELGLNDKRIQNACRKNSKPKSGNAYGYHWEYVI